MTFRPQKNRNTRTSTVHKKWLLRLAVLISIIGAISTSQFYWVENLPTVNDVINNAYGRNLTIKQINIVGNNQLSSDHIIELSGLHLGDNLFDLDVNNARSLLEQNGWIESASVSRVYPSTVNISIVEEIPQALWWNKELFYLVASSGRTIQQVSAPTNKPEHILIFGAEAPTRYAKLYQDLFNLSISSEIIALSSIRGRRWDIYLNDATLIKLPEINVDKALIVLDKLHKNGILKNNDLRELDLRLSPEKIFVKRK